VAIVQNKGGTGYILVVGPALALIAGIFSIASLFKNVANTPVPVIGFNLGMIGEENTRPGPACAHSLP
jgi:hypothetical protein